MIQLAILWINLAYMCDKCPESLLQVLYGIMHLCIIFHRALVEAVLRLRVTVRQRAGISHSK